MAGIINTVAWVLCAVVGFMLFSDFIRTEIKLSKEKKKKQEEELNGHGTAEK